MTREQAEYACRIGLMRRQAALDRGAKHVGAHDPPTKKDREIQCRAAVAEYFAALELDRRWLSTGRKRDSDSDIEGGLEAKWSQAKSAERAMLHAWRHNLSKFVYVLVMGRWPTLEIVGWQLGDVLMQPANWRNAGELTPNGEPAHTSAWFLPSRVIIRTGFDELRILPGEAPSDVLCRLRDPAHWCRRIVEVAFEGKGGQ